MKSRWLFDLRPLRTRPSAQIQKDHHQNARSEQEAATWSLYLVTNWFWRPLCYTYWTYNYDDAENYANGDADDIDYDIDDDTDDDIDDTNNDADGDVDDSQP